jgi:hypothetical protein
MRSNARILLCCGVLTGIVGVLLVIGGSAQCAGLAAEAQYAAPSQAAIGGLADKDTLCMLRFVLPQDLPAYVTNGDPPVILPIRFINECPWEAQIETIVTEEISGSGWLSVSSSSLVLPPNSETVFNIQVIPPPPGTPKQWLEGYVHFTSSAWDGDTWPLHIKLYAADIITDAAYDTVATSTAWDGKGGRGIGDNVALVVSNFGQIGNWGEGGVNLDFTVDGNECNPDMDRYLYAASPFYIQKIGTAYSLTTSHYATEQWKPGSWVAATGTVMSRGFGSHDGVSYDSVYAGESYNRDTTVAIERTFYAPRDNTRNPSFVVTRTRLYSVGGSARSNITFGSVTDWDIPSDNGSGTNTSGVVLDGPFVYFQGTDHPDSTPCQLNVQRFGAEVFVSWYARAVARTNPCASDTIKGMKAVSVRRFLDDTLIGGVNQPDAKKWWDSLAIPGYASLPTPADQGGFVTFLHNYNLAANDTLTFWTILAAMRNGSLATFTSNIADAKFWYKKLRVPCSCCFVMGNVDDSQDYLVTMGDLTVMIDHLFITLTPLICPEAGNVDLSGDDLVTMGDLTVLIDHLFISLAPLPACQ